MYSTYMCSYTFLCTYRPWKIREVEHVGRTAVLAGAACGTKSQFIEAVRGRVVLARTRSCEINSM
jgi:hypothetical protein